MNSDTARWSRTLGLLEHQQSDSEIWGFCHWSAGNLRIESDGVNPGSSVNDSRGVERML